MDLEGATKEAAVEIVLKVMFRRRKECDSDCFKEGNYSNN